MLVACYCVSTLAGFFGWAVVRLLNRNPLPLLDLRLVRTRGALLYWRHRMSSPIISVGDTIRLYGYPGVFQAGAVGIGAMGIEFVPVYRQGVCLWKSPVSSVVEVNGVACPMRSCPICDIADDYPHEPTFDYTDGPQENAVLYINLWNSRKGAQ